MQDSMAADSKGPEEHCPKDHLAPHGIQLSEDPSPDVSQQKVSPTRRGKAAAGAHSDEAHLNACRAPSHAQMRTRTSDLNSPAAELDVMAGSGQGHKDHARMLDSTHMAHAASPSAEELPPDPGLGKPAAELDPLSDAHSGHETQRGDLEAADALAGQCDPDGGAAESLSDGSYSAEGLSDVSMACLGQSDEERSAQFMTALADKMAQRRKAKAITPQVHCEIL